MMKKIITLLALTSLTATAYAAQPAGTYDPGRILDQIKEKPVAPPKKPAEIDNEMKEPSKPQPVRTETGPKVKVAGFKISGMTVFTESQLQAVLSGFQGKELTLGELKQVSAKLTSFYQDKGYFLAYAYLPPQEIKGGVVQIAVLEGKLGKVQFKKGQGTRLSDNVLDKGLNGVEPNAVLKQDLLEKRLQLLNTLPGIEINADLQPGATTGAADLILNVKEKKTLELVLDTDNYGNLFSGEYRGGATINVNDPFGAGDQLSLRGMTAGEGLLNTRLSYLVPVGYFGTKLGASYSYLHYALGGAVVDAQQSGLSHLGSLFVNQPLFINRNVSLYGQVGYDYKAYEDSTMGATQTKHAHAGNASVMMSSNDALCGGGVTNLNLAVSGGALILDEQLESQDSSGGQLSQGMYGKANLNLTRLQAVANNSTFLYLSFDGQKAFKNLDTTEKYSLGGINGVRAYPGGEAPGDNGFVATAELRHNLVSLKDKVPGDLQAVMFYDYGRAQLNDHAFNGGTKAIEDRSGAGIGFNWGMANNFSLRTSVAWVTGNHPTDFNNDLKVSDGTGRFPRAWFQLVKWF